MKPPRDDETNWDQLVASGIMGPEFQAAWETLKGSGIGSTEATSHVSNLIRGSGWHLERLHIQHETSWRRSRNSAPVSSTRPLSSASCWARFFAAASSYMVMGTMLGYRCRRHFQHFLLVEAERQIIDAAIERPPVKASA